jgi:two-component system, NtrC family, sensor kinase
VSTLQTEGFVRDVQCALRTKSGRQLLMVFSADRVLVGGELFLLVCAYDITEKKRAEEELARYRTHLEELVAERTRQLEESRARLIQSEHLASIGTLAAGIAHEINNPVGTMLLAAENALELRNAPAAEHLVEDCLKGIVAEARRCGEVIRSVLQFARHEQTQKSETPVGDIVRRGVELTAAYCQQHGISVSTELAEDLPKVAVDPLQMSQVFVNLIRNAVEAGRKGGRVLIRGNSTAQSVRITVEDNGPGIAEEHLSRVFDPFFTTRRERGGTGLGLSIAHGIIVEHGGTVSVHSRLGTGTTFTVELPAVGRGESEDPHGQGADRRR